MRKRLESWIRFGVRALRRQKRAAAMAAALTLVASVAALALTKPAYRVQVRILTHRSALLPALLGPRREVRLQGLSDAAGAADQILARASLEAVAEMVHLPERWAENRGVARRLADDLRTRLFGPLSREQVLDILVGMLEDRIGADVQRDVIRIEVEWSDPDTARDLAQAALDHFLGERLTAELEQLEDSLQILDERLARAKPDVDRAEAALRQAAARSRAAHVAVPRSLLRQQQELPTTEELTELAARRKQLEQLENDYETRLEDARSKMERLNDDLGPSHPDLLDAARELSDASREPPQLEELRLRVTQLEGVQEQLTPQAASGALAAELDLPVLSGDRDPLVDQALGDYRRARERYNDLLTRRDTARLERDAAQTGFGYRYTVTLPPLRPRDPRKPHPVKILLVTLLAALAWAVTAAVTQELRTGRVVEAWMLDDLTGLAVLGEVEEP
jgi:uncharacterized protein involved in exopolysaccharide biosynthesis